MIDDFVYHEHAKVFRSVIHTSRTARRPFHTLAFTRYHLNVVGCRCHGVQCQGQACNMFTMIPVTCNMLSEPLADDPGPGPGQYGPSMDFSNPGVRFGSSTRYQNPGSGTPSPLDYKPDPSKVLRASASFSFGGKHKNEHLKSKTPGPGHYEPGVSGDIALTQNTRPWKFCDHPSFCVLNYLSMCVCLIYCCCDYRAK